MFRHQNSFVRLTALALILSVFAFGGFRRKKYENPINKDTKQPDKVLFDKAIKDIEHGRYEVARLTLNTMINTYDQSEFLAKAKLAIADSWYREGGSHGMAQAEAEYKDFKLFYPMMEEAAESQSRICDIHYKQMEKSDRDQVQALRANDECMQLLVEFPNSKYVAQTEQRLRNVQESLAEGEFRVGYFYHHKGSNPAAANRLSHLVDQYPLYSKADEALWQLGDSYEKMGTRFRPKAGEAYARIVRDYPLSPWADAARKQLKELELPIPKADPAAEARMTYEDEHRTKRGVMTRALGLMSRSPDTHTAAKSGKPSMTSLRPTIPASVPGVATGTSTGITDVSATTVTDPTALDTQPDARRNPPPAASATTAPATAAPAPPEVLPTNRVASAKDIKRMQEMKAKQDKAREKKNKGKKPTAATPADAKAADPTAPAEPAK